MLFNGIWWRDGKRLCLQTDGRLNENLANDDDDDDGLIDDAGDGEDDGSGGRGDDDDDVDNCRKVFKGGGFDGFDPTARKTSTNFPTVDAEAVIVIDDLNN